ncbi:hypothetical protein [Ruminococcus sp.]|uniref:hypothetical protein n=1 Tax=Ruminococcus sp. TaxID=41978 RepID=UPI0025FD4846|nr:hypothetical protein [Ruminococcus sp.]MBQ8967639.1 hypothetical protein [Ruminococcus sp.]
MSATAKFRLSIIMAFVFSFFSAGAGNAVKPQAFFPSQAVSLKEEKVSEGGITVIKGDDIEFSFFIAELIGKCFK